MAIDALHDRESLAKAMFIAEAEPTSSAIADRLWQQMGETTGARTMWHEQADRVLAHLSSSQPAPRTVTEQDRRDALGALWDTRFTHSPAEEVLDRILAALGIVVGVPRG